MNAPEDILRQAYLDAAATVTQSDLRLVPDARRGFSRARLTRSWLSRRFTIPALAAVATALIAVIAIVVPAHLLSAAGGPAAANVRGEPGAAPDGFFAVLSPDGGSVQIRSAVTGRLLAQVTPPGHGEFFSGVAAAARDGRDGGTLLLAAERAIGGGCKTWLYRLRLSAAGQPSALSAAPIPSISGILPGRALAATPDGSAIAAGSYFCDGNGSLQFARFAVRPAVRWPTQGGDQVDGMSLSANGTELSISGYEFAGFGPGPKPGTSSVRLKPVTAVLQTSGAASGLSGQRIILRRPAVAALSPDGSTLYACTEDSGRDVLGAYSVAARTLRRVVASWTAASGNCSFALDGAGRYALIATAAGHLARIDIGTGRLTELPPAGLPGSDILSW